MASYELARFDAPTVKATVSRVATRDGILLRGSATCYTVDRLLSFPAIQDHSKLLLSKEWLVKIDSDNSVPYMLVRAVWI